MRDVILFHTHGIGAFDFSVMNREQLVLVDRLAEQRHAYLCPTIYLKEERVRAQGQLFRSFAELKASGELRRFLGFAIEGPVLGPRGGIPRGSVWQPTYRQWDELCSWFPLGLKYIVMAPDVLAIEDRVDEELCFADLLSRIYDAGGRIALGHFAGERPADSARRTMDVLDYLEANYHTSRYLVLTDHLFNDMPRNFQHAFRGEVARRNRRQALLPLLAHPWDPSELESLLGPVPAVLVNAARNERLTPALNFDGGHVDLEICRRVVEFLGNDRVIAMTDHTETLSLAGEPLTLDPEGTLLYRGDGVLAASAVRHEQQVENMRQLGMSAASINRLFFETALEALSFAPAPRGKAGS